MSWNGVLLRGDDVSEMSVHTIGVGSLVKQSHNVYLLVATDHNHVIAVDTNTYLAVGNPIEVLDRNFLSASEFDEIFHRLQCTRSDFEIDSKGVKGNRLWSKSVQRGLESKTIRDKLKRTL